MKLFTESKDSSSQKGDVKHQAYGSPLVDLGEGDFTKPYINSSSVGSSTFIRFGRDNRFPQLIDQMYYHSPLHASIVDFQINAAIGGGFDIKTAVKKTGEERVAELTFLKKIKAPKMVRSIALDLKMHKRFHLMVKKQGADILSVTRILPAKVRYNKEANKFWISDDWFSSRNVSTYGEFDFAPTKNDKTVVEQVYSYIDLDSSPGQDVYPLDRTVAAFNWMYLDGQSANLQKDNIQRSIFGNLVIKKPTEFKSDEEFDIFKRGIESKQGEIVPVLLLSADGVENLPIVESFPANENDKAFENLDKRIDDKICQAHTINPLVMGISRPGALGSGGELSEAYPIWEKNVVMPFRKQIEEVMSDVMFLFKIQGEFILKEYSMIEGLVEEVKEEEFTNEGGVFGKETKTDEPISINENLRGLSAAQNSDIYRIIRDHTKGNLNTSVAEARLSAYGFDKETIENILKQD